MSPGEVVDAFRERRAVAEPGRLRGPVRAALVALTLVVSSGLHAQPGPAPKVIAGEAVSGKAAASESSAGGALAYRPFRASPFPYEGIIPETGKPFLDVTKDGRRGHTSPRGGVLWEDQTYADRTTLLFVPKGFSLERPAFIVLYLHGNLATLQRDVVGRQRVPHQLQQSGLNAVLLAPQFASNALDSSAGHFWDPNFLSRFIDEASGHLAELYRDGGTRERFARLPVVIVAYSGGYMPAAFSLAWDGLRGRVRGVILLDALFGETDKFAEWIMRRHASTFFFSGYSDASQAQNAALRDTLAQHGIETTTGVPGRLDDGTIAFLSAGHVDHTGFVSHAWTSDPLVGLLSRVKAVPAAVPADAHDRAPPPLPPIQDPDATGAATPSPPASPFGTLSKRGVPQ